MSLSLFKKGDSILHKDIFYGAANTKAKLRIENIQWQIPYI